jgi:hypothetical protein
MIRQSSNPSLRAFSSFGSAIHEGSTRKYPLLPSVPFPLRTLRDLPFPQDLVAESPYGESGFMKVEFKGLGMPSGKQIFH